ncbi:MAG: ABC transporter substrate-binding protein, partial [Thermoleophilia bacterium]|nr:ABC transporter substrate-binding protein [Thermoleophilia bacterium]
MRNLRRVVATLAVALVALAAVAVALAADGDEKIVLTIGLTNDYDTLNPVVGVEVPDYEVWNVEYATLTDKAAADFATIPGLAESWEASNDGKTYTYTLREGLTWSDGTPLTAEDVAYTVNRARDEAWLNYESVVANLDATAIDERTVEIASKVPDPKLPTMDVYILPKHVYEKLDDKAVTKYDGTDGVGSGPFTLVEAKRGQFWRMAANPGYWGWNGEEPPYDEVVYRLFNNGDAMVAALEKGEIDAAHDVPTESFERLGTTEGIVTVVGEQGGFSEVSVNGGRPADQRVDGIGNGHPALSDIEFRKAIAHAIDKQTIIDKVLVGLGSPATVMSPSADPGWRPEIPESEQFAFDLEQAKQILDDAGYTDTNGNGLREYEGKDINLTYLVRTESQTAGPNAEFVSGWLKEIGIGTTLKPVNDSRLTELIGKGDYDLFEWGWTPFVDPDPMLSYFTCGQLSKDPEDPTNYYNDANWCDPAYDEDYTAQNQELDQAKRKEIVAGMLRDFYGSATYNVLYYDGDLQAYRTDRFEGWLRQPADTGPVLFSNSSPTYANLTPIASTASDGGGISTGAIIGIVVAGVIVLGG